jgi:hypothetical protein
MGVRCHPGKVPAYLLSADMITPEWLACWWGSYKPPGGEVMYLNAGAVFIVPFFRA